MKVVEINTKPTGSAAIKVWVNNSKPYLNEKIKDFLKKKNIDETYKFCEDHMTYHKFIKLREQIFFLCLIRM